MRRMIRNGAVLMAALLALPVVAQAAETVQKVAAACCGCGCC